jgi:hypothetical protein
VESLQCNGLHHRRGAALTHRYIFASLPTHVSVAIASTSNPNCRIAA